MAITVTELTSNSSTSNTTNYATAAINPTANTLVLLAVHTTRGSSTDPVVPTVATAGGLTWVEVGNILTQDSGTLRGRFTLFRAMASSPSSSAVTIQHSATMTGCMWSITQWSGVDTGGTNGSAAVAEAVFDRVDASTTLTCTLTGVTSGNVVYSASGFLGTQTWEEEGGWTELPATEVSIATPDAKMGGAYLLADTDSSHTATLSSGNDIGGVIVEIKAAPAGGTAYDITTATETDTAQALTFTKPIVKAVTQAEATDAAQALRVPRLTAATETDTAQPADADKSVTITPGVVTHTAGTLRVPRLVTALETDSAEPLTLAGGTFKDLTPGTETDSAQALSFTKPIFVTLGIATVTHTAQALTVTKPILLALTLAGETDTAEVLTSPSMSVYVAVPFGPPSPTGGMIVGAPNGGQAEGTPEGGEPVGTPGGAFFGPPSPGGGSG